jgi:HEAT repeat protein
MARIEDRRRDPLAFDRSQMSDSVFIHDDAQPSTPRDAGRDLPDTLPPVEPPSAGFIIQLFVIPAVIVAAVIGVVSIPRMLVRSQQDWRQLVVELQSTNEHRRWRAALSLAQVLRADEELGAAGQQLSHNSEIATALSDLLRKQLERTAPDEDAIRQQAFLARTLGFLEVPDVVLPTLQQAMRAGYDLDIRRNAIASISLIAGRALERAEPLEHPRLVDDLIAATGDPEAPIRHLAAFTLGLLPTSAARQQLAVLADNEGIDRDTRVNAAVGLARQHSTSGLPLFREVLTEATGHRQNKAEDARADQFERFVTVRNTVKAVGLLRDDLSSGEREEFTRLLEPIADRYPQDRIRLDAQEAIALLAGK